MVKRLLFRLDKGPSDIAYFALDNMCYRFTVSDAKVIKQDIQDLESYHEEADTRMVYHLHYIIQHQDVTNVSIRSNDTDVLVILLYYVSQNESAVRIRLDTGLNINNTRRQISISVLVIAIGKVCAEVLAGYMPSLIAITPLHS